MKRVSDFHHLKVVTIGGKSLGHVFDLRSPGSAEYGLANKERVISELVCGELGLMERLGLKQSKTDTIRWSSVVEIKDGKITVDLEK